MPSDLLKAPLAGAAYPLGASCDPGGCNFAVYAGNAEQIDLCLFDASGRQELRRLTLRECTDGVWHGYVEGIAPGQLYGYRALGPYLPEQGHRYNVNKLLLDPYARRLAGTLRWSDALYGYRLTSPRADLSFDRRDSAFAMPKGVVTVDRFDWGDDQPPRTSWTDTIIYEAHLRGLTMRLEGIPEPLRGTAAALGHERTVEYLKSIGITAVELLPIHASVNDRVLVERGLANYWGYNTLGFFAPEPRYLSDGNPDELKGAIKALHAAGIEVLLDVVYNHTGEGSELGPTLSLRGLDNAAYYRLLPDNLRSCINDTGTGNTVNFSNARVIQLTLDSLRYWVEHYHVDGFRFDLSVTLGREQNGYDPGSGFFDAMLQDPTLARVKLIGEPWDLGPGGYQVGNHPAGMAEWNDKFRDDVRRFWRGDSGLRGALAARLQGSADLFDHHGRRPWASLNFITAHDGFTLQDWVSYNRKHNEANGENNRDGTDNNASNNWGVEGPTDDATVQATRAAVRRAMLATLLFSHGTPMLLGGDECGRTQHGNNNAWCQDNEVSWYDWDHEDPQRELTEFTRRLIVLRRDHVVFRRRSFLSGTGDGDGLPDVWWFRPDGRRMTQRDWRAADGHVLGAFLNGAALHERTRDGEPKYDDSFLVFFNAHFEDVTFLLPAGSFGRRWTLELSTAEPSAAAGSRNYAAREPVAVTSRSVLVLRRDGGEARAGGRRGSG